MIARPRTLILPIVAALALSACVSSRPLQQQEAREPAAGEGTVIGTVLMRGGRDLLGRTKWELVAAAAGGPASAPQYVIDVHRDGAEELFVTTLPAGRYQFRELRQTLVSNFRAQTNIVFQVYPGTATYIGRLTLEFPPGLITTYSPLRLSVEDAKAAAIAEAGTRRGKPYGAVGTALMVVGQGAPSKLPGQSTADERLENDALTLLMAMDGAEESACKERHVVNREILSASATGAEERWTIARCSKPVRYRVTFAPDPRGGTRLGVAIER